MKTYFAVALIALLTGCASNAPSQFYRPANYSGVPWAITGSFNDFSRAIEISFDGQKVVEGSLSVFLGDGEFSANYMGKPVQVSCLTSRGFAGRKVGCQVFVSGERAANLSF